MSTRAIVTGPEGRQQDLGRAELDLICACGQHVLVFEKGIIHKLPMCADFESREPLEFLTWYRKRAEKLAEQEPS